MMEMPHLFDVLRFLPIPEVTLLGQNITGHYNRGRNIFSAVALLSFMCCL